MYRPAFSKILVTTSTEEGGDESSTIPKAPPMLKPSEKRTSGQFKRYFVEHLNQRIIYEVSEKTYLELVSQSTVYDYRVYRAISLDWDATIPKQDQQYGKYKKEGSNTKNLKKVRILEEKMEGLMEYLKDAEELF